MYLVNYFLTFWIFYKTFPVNWNIFSTRVFLSFLNPEVHIWYY